MCYVVLMACIGLVNLLGGFPVGSPTVDESTDVEQLTGWSYQWDTQATDLGTLVTWPLAPDAWRQATSLFQPSPREANLIWFRTQLPEQLPADAALIVPTVLLDYEVYVDTLRIFAANEHATYTGAKYASTTAHLIDLPPNAEGERLLIRVYSSSQSFIGVTKPVFVGKPMEILRAAWLYDVELFLIGVLVFTSGLGAVLILLFLRHRSEVLPVAAFVLLTLTIGANYITDSTLIRVLFPYPVVLYFASVAAIFMPVGLLTFFSEVIGEGPRHIIRWLAGVHLVFALSAYGLDIAGLIIIPELFFVFFLLFGLSMVVMVGVVIAEVRQGSYEARVFGGMFLVLIVLGIHDTVFLGLGVNPNQPSISPFGFLVLVFALVYLLQFRFRENIRRLAVRTNELRSINATLEMRVAERTAEVEASLTHLKATQRQLVQSEKLASLGSLTAGIAHELKNPLNFIKNFAALSRDIVNEVDEERAEAPDLRVAEVDDLLDDLRLNAHKIEQHSQRADGIIRSMMAHAASGPSDKKRVAINALVEEYVNLAYHGRRARHAEFHVELVTDFDESVREAVWAPQEIGRVILNVLSNAFDAIANRTTPRVTISTMGKGGQVVIRVADNGPGIPEDVQAKIFEPFFTTKPTGQGTGLGLSLSYDIVTQGHGGTMMVESAPGDGAMFTIGLPYGNQA